MRTLFLTSLALAAVATPAVAQEAGSAFDGPYVGVQLGINQDRADAKLKNTVILDKRVKRNTFATGIFVGYNFRIAKSIVVSPEAGFTINVNDSVDGKQAGVATYTLDAKRTFDLGARVGVLASKNTLLYVRGGYLNARVGFNAALADGTTVRSKQTVSGFNVGGGIEQALGGGFSARAEYRYSKLDKDGGKWRRHALMAGVAYNF